MIRVSNRKTLRRLGYRTLKAARTRNLIAVLAIALTTVLFTSLFTIALSINDGFQQSNFRQCGGWNHGTFKYLTEEQFQTLKEDETIKDWGLRRFLGTPTEEPFRKAHVEVGYSDENQAHWMYCDPAEGRLPREGTNEAATDTRVLSLLGVEPELGAEFTLTFDVDGHPTTQTFTLCGWWEYDEAITASHVLVPQSRVEEVLAEVGTDPYHSADGMTGSWNLDVMFPNALHIQQDMDQVLADWGYQSREQGDNYISTGVNWGYTGSQLADQGDPILFLALGAMLVLIIFTGYLIIYNVFQISVTNDVRFYGLLKTIGTTGRQIKAILRQQALILSGVGIPIGLVLGWLVGGQLAPVVIRRLDGVENVVSVRPVIFLGAAVFSLLTVLLSCARPGRMAAKVSPVEAARYTEGGRQKVRKGQKGVSLPAMAWANLGRSKGRTAVTILSLSLAVVLLTVTVTFTKGFDMDKYLRYFVSADFVLADAGYFQTGGELFNESTALPEEAIEEAAAQAGITQGGRTYGLTTPVQEFVTEDYFRAVHGRWNDQETLDILVDRTERDDAGNLADDVQLYGMEPFVLDQLTVLEGDLSRLREPGGNYVAAVYADDDYGNPVETSHWARLGDKITLRYVEKFEYYDPETGEVFGEDEDLEGRTWQRRAVQYRDVEYEVAALVVVPSSLSYRYYGTDEFVMNDQTFLRDTGSSSVMYYACNTTEEAAGAMETFLQDFTGNSPYDYESKATYEGEFESFRSMFLLLGGALSFVVGLVGVLNFVNAVLTGIFARRREFAVLQAVGMTGRQLKTMLVWEGLFYALGAAALALAVTAVLSPLTGSALESLFWFFTYRFTLSPILVLAPVFALLGCLVPLAVYRAAAKSTLVERLREAES